MAASEQSTGNSDYARICPIDIVQATEAAALAAASFTGRGDEMGADQAALEAMANSLHQLPVGGRIIIGEGDFSESSHLQTDSILGGRQSHDVDLAVMPLEGSSINARALSNALSVIAVAEKDSLLRLPPMYMDKIAIGPGYAPGLVGLDRSPKENIEALANAKGVPASEITVCILDRTRHRDLIATVREAGAAIRLIGDGDIAGVIQTADPEETGIDMYMGLGGSDQGILAAAALRCIGGQIEGRLVVRGEEDKRLLNRFDIKDPRRLYTLDDMVGGDVTFAATGVTDGYMLNGVRRFGDTASTQSIVMRASCGTIRTIDTLHTVLDTTV